MKKYNIQNNIPESKDPHQIFDDACTIYEKCVKPQGPCDFDGEQFKQEREKYLIQFPSWRGGVLPKSEGHALHNTIEGSITASTMLLSEAERSVYFYAFFEGIKHAQTEVKTSFI